MGPFLIPNIRHMFCVYVCYLTVTRLVQRLSVVLMDMVKVKM